jgi:Arc/MetJ-type ribon-helix-helix transcriptional regulator
MGGVPVTTIESREIETSISRAMESGRYQDVEHLLREALDLVERRDADQLLRGELARGFDQIARGETVPYDANSMDEMQLQATRNASAGKPLKDAVKS